MCVTKIFLYTPYSSRCPKSSAFQVGKQSMNHLSLVGKGAILHGVYVVSSRMIAFASDSNFQTF